MNIQSFLPPANEVARRFCFYTCLWFCSQGGHVSQHASQVTWVDTHHPPPVENPQGRHPPPGRHPLPDGQWAGGTHPTGMHSCIFLRFLPHPLQSKPLQWDMMHDEVVQFVASNSFSLRPFFLSLESTANSHWYKPCLCGELVDFFLYRPFPVAIRHPSLWLTRLTPDNTTRRKKARRVRQLVLNFLHP